MTYKPLTIGRLMACQSCYAVVCEYDQDDHEQAMHSEKITISDAAGNIVATYPDDWRDPVIADKNTCYHPEGTDEPPH